jgi:hypothetical protein
MIESVLNRIARAWNRLFASKELLPYERLVLDAWRASMSEENQRILDAQLDAVSLVQHQAAGAKVCFYYREDHSIPLFRADQPDLHAATVLLRSEGTSETLRAKIFVHRGRFFSIEFPKRPDRYMQQHHMQARTLQVSSVEDHIAIV